MSGFRDRLLLLFVAALLLWLGHDPQQHGRRCCRRAPHSVAAAWISPVPSSSRAMTAPAAEFSSPRSSNGRRTILSMHEQRRRTKRNKYDNFSKVEPMDPLEALLQESERKNGEFLAEQQKKASRRTEIHQKNKARPSQPIITEIAPLPQVEFPDTKDIDPYDPQTFGYVEIGGIMGAHGVHGWLKIRCSTDFAQERLCTPGIRHLKAPAKRAPRQMVLLQGRHRHGDEYLIQLDNVCDRDAAQKLRGSTLYIREEQQAADDVGQDPEEYLVQDLVGLEVFLEQDLSSPGHGEGDDKQFVGTVGGVVFSDDLSSTLGLGHDYLELILPRGVGGTASWKDEMVLIPLVPQIVPRVDIQGGAMYLDPPTGLLDLTYVREEKTRIKGFLPTSSSAQDDNK